MCVETARDAEELWRRGVPLAQIRAYVDAKYQPLVRDFGVKPTPTPPPPGSGP